MQLDIFITCEELVVVINELLKKTGCAVFIASDRNQSYKSLVSFVSDDILNCRNMEIGMLSDAKLLLSKPVKDIYREDRVGFVSVNPNCQFIPPDVLLATVFSSDASDTAKVIFKTLRKVLSGFAHKGVKVINDRTEAMGTSKEIYWTDGALASGKIWKQAETSDVRFQPL